MLKIELHNSRAISCGICWRNADLSERDDDDEDRHTAFRRWMHINSTIIGPAIGLAGLWSLDRIIAAVQGSRVSRRDTILSIYRRGRLGTGRVIEQMNCIEGLERRQSAAAVQDLVEADFRLAQLASKNCRFP